MDHGRETDLLDMRRNTIGIAIGLRCATPLGAGPMGCASRAADATRVRRSQ